MPFALTAEVEGREEKVVRESGCQWHLFGAILVPLALFCILPAQSFAASITNGRGFGELKWGETLQQAQQIYPDLHFEGYRIVTEKEMPYRAYVRERTTIRIDGVRFDSLEYWFRGDKFLKILAVLYSRIGPRTLVTEAERSYDALKERLRRTFGDPTDQTVKYVTDYLALVKETTWEMRGVLIRLKYNGADQVDVDRLTLEMEKSGGEP